VVAEVSDKTGSNGEIRLPHYALGLDVKTQEPQAT
jgi:hypothetical protein